MQPLMVLWHFLRREVQSWSNSSFSNYKYNSDSVSFFCGQTCHVWPKILCWDVSTNGPARTMCRAWTSVWGALELPGKPGGAGRWKDTTGTSLGPTWSPGCTDC